MRLYTMCRLLAVLFASQLFLGCATSTSPGTVGVTRPQLMMVPSGGINAQAATAYTKLSSEMSAAGKLNSDPAQAARVKEIARKLIQQTAAFRPDALSWSWEVNVIQSEKINAFCMPGGKIGVTSAMLSKLDLTDPEVATVIGHEIAHALREHSREKRSQDVLAAAIVEGVARSGGRYAGTAAVLTQVGSQLFVQLPYSREMESESDSIGLELMARAGYDPTLAAGLWIKMAAHSGGGGATDFFSTHPSDDKRTADIQALATRVLALYTAAVLKQQPPPSTAASPPTPINLATIAQPEVGTAAVPPAVADSAQGSRPKKPTLGPDSYQIERMLRGSSCSDAPIAVLVEKGAGYENYVVACSAGPSLRFRCEYGNCIAVN